MGRTKGGPLLHTRSRLSIAPRRALTWVALGVLLGVGGVAEAGLDTDGDGLSDFDESDVYDTDPLDADTDDDGVSDGDEVLVTLTDPLNLDSDFDGVQDGTELGVAVGLPDTDPLFFVPDADEGATVTDPNLEDTDFGGLLDGLEDFNLNGRVDPGELDPNNPGDDVCPDLDEDSFADARCGGLDCNDDDPFTSPESPEILCDGPDNNCDESDEPVYDGDLGALVGLAVVQGDTCGAGNDFATSLGSTVTCAADQESEDLAYTWRPPTTGRYFFDTDGTNFDVALQIRALGCPNEELACNDEVTEVLEFAQVSLELVADEDVVIVVDGFSEGNCGLFTLNITEAVDTDMDGLFDQEEAPLGTLPGVADTDEDTLSDGDEVNIHGTNPLEPDSDMGGVPDGQELLDGTDPNDPEDDLVCVDPDDDGVCDPDDNCPLVSNADQLNADGDLLGDVCDDDDDDDAVLDDDDSCPLVPNAGQEDLDQDGAGDACDEDDDNDEVLDEDDNCPLTANPDQRDVDADQIGDACDDFVDEDNDGVADSEDNCPGLENDAQEDIDEDQIGDACDPAVEVSGELVGGTLCSQVALSPTRRTPLLPLALLVGLGILGARRRRSRWWGFAAGCAALAALLGCSSPAPRPPIGPVVNSCFSQEAIAPRPIIGEGGARATITPEHPFVDARAGFVEEDDGHILVLAVPDGVESVALVVEGSGDDVIVASTVQAPSGHVVWDYMRDIGANKTSANDEPYTLLLPSNTAVTMEPGEWLIKLMTDSPKGKMVHVEAFYKTEAVKEGVLDLNLFFVGVEGLSAAQAPQDPTFQEVLRSAEAIFKGAGVRFGDVKYIDVVGADAERYAITSAITGELEALFKLSEGREERALNFFFVADLEGDASGFSLLGKAGGVPGPPGKHGTAKSGVVVNMASFRESPETVSIVMAHEASHYLGLFHTTERNGTGLDDRGIMGFDPLCDTLLCPDQADANANRVLSARECAPWDGHNLMFSLATRSSRGLTPAQGQLLRRSFLVR